MKRRETLAAALIACQDDSCDCRWEQLKYLRNSVVARAVYRRFKKWKKKGGRANVSAQNQPLVASVLGIFEGDRNFDGTFLREMITFLLENADEIIALIMKIIGLFGVMNVRSYDIEEFTAADQKIVFAVFAPADPDDEDELLSVVTPGEILGEVFFVGSY